MDWGQVKMLWHRLLLLLIVLAFIPFVNADIEDNVIAYWNCNNESDLSGNSRDLTEIGFTSFSSSNSLIEKNCFVATDTSGSDYFSVDGSTSDMDNQPLTLNFWFRLDDSSGEDQISAISKWLTSSANGYLFWIDHNAVAPHDLRFQTNTVSDCQLNSFLDEDRWYMITWRFSTGGLNQISIDGSAECSWTETPNDNSISLHWGSTAGIFGNQEQVEMRYDEMGVWDRVILSSEITTLYNGGLGITLFEPESSGNGTENPMNPRVVLQEPEDNSAIANTGVNFTTIYTVNTGYNLTNATYFIWNSTFDLINETTLLLDGNDTNTTEFFGPFDIGIFQWNVQACADNVTDFTCMSALANYTFSSAFSIINESFNNASFETDTERFEINISTLPDILNINAFLIYDGTAYFADTSCEDSGNCTIQRKIDITLAKGDESEIKNFSWNISVFDGIAVLNTMTPLQTQNVSRVHLEECDGTFTVQSLNFTAYDERNTTRINPYSFEGTFKYWLGGGSVKQNTSIDQTSTIEVPLCIDPPDRSFFVDSDITYTQPPTTTYVETDYHQQSDTITNSSRDIFLYLLDEEFTTTFILQVQDINIQPVIDALIQIERYYPAENAFRVVQIAKTDGNGESVGFYETEIVDYKHTIIKNNTVLLATEQGKIVGKVIPFTLIFTIGEDSSVPYSVFESDPLLLTNLTYDTTTRIVKFTWIDLSGQATSGRLLVEQPLFGRTGTTVICDEFFNFATGTITCNVTGFSGTILAKGYVTKSTTVLTNLVNLAIGTAQEVFDKNGLIMGWFIILTASMVFLWNPTVGIVAVNASIWFVNLIGLATFNPIFIFGIMGVSILAIVLLKT